LKDQGLQTKVAQPANAVGQNNCTLEKGDGVNEPLQMTGSQGENHLLKQNDLNIGQAKLLQKQVPKQS